MNEVKRKPIGAAFKPETVDRAAGLGDLVPVRTPRAPLESAALSASAGEAASVEAPRVTPKPAVIAETRAAVAKPPKARSEASGGAVANVAAYLPPETLTGVRAEIRRRDLTYAELLAVAFDSIDVAELKVALAPVPVANGKMMPARQRRSRGQAGIQIQLRLDGHQTLWLDEQAERFGAPSRSALVAAVYKQFLDSTALPGLR